MPARPTLIDFFNLRFRHIRNSLPFPPGHHCIQSARLAMKAGQSEETILACLLHDLGLWLIKPDHGWWGAQLVEPYVAEKVSWAIRYHQALRFFPDAEVGYEYPEMYTRMFGPDYRPPAHIVEAYNYARKHPWYMDARLITLFDDYSFDPAVIPEVEPFADIIGRHFRQPVEGLGADGTAVAHMWRTMIDPDRPV
jgi:predicted HD phosphohydrolase